MTGIAFQRTRIGHLGLIEAREVIQHHAGVIGMLALCRFQFFSAQVGLQCFGRLAAYAMGMPQHGVRGSHSRRDLQRLLGMNGGLFGVIDRQFGGSDVEAQTRVTGCAIGRHGVGIACLCVPCGGHQRVAERQQDDRVTWPKAQRCAHAFDRLIGTTVGNFQAGQIALHLKAVGGELFGLV